MSEESLAHWGSVAPKTDKLKSLRLQLWISGNILSCVLEISVFVIHTLQPRTHRLREKKIIILDKMFFLTIVLQVNP